MEEFYNRINSRIHYDLVKYYESFTPLAKSTFDRLIRYLSQDIINNPCYDTYYSLYLCIGGIRKEIEFNIDLVKDEVDDIQLLEVLMIKLINRLLSDISMISKKKKNIKIKPELFGILFELKEKYSSLKWKSEFSIFLYYKYPKHIMTAFNADPIIFKMDGAQLNRIAYWMPNTKKFYIIEEDDKFFISENKSAFEFEENEENEDEYKEIGEIEVENLKVSPYAYIKDNKNVKEISLKKFYKEYKLYQCYVKDLDDENPNLWVSIIEVGNNDNYQP